MRPHKANNSSPVKQKFARKQRGGGRLQQLGWGGTYSKLTRVIWIERLREQGRRICLRRCKINKENIKKGNRLKQREVVCTNSVQNKGARYLSYEEKKTQASHQALHRTKIRKEQGDLKKQMWSSIVRFQRLAGSTLIKERARSHRETVTERHTHKTG